MPLPRPFSVSTVTTEGSTRRTSAGKSAPAVVTGAVELGGAAVVPVEPGLVELLHAARKVTVTASSRSIQTQGRTVDVGCISSAPPFPLNNFRAGNRGPPLRQAAPLRDRRAPRRIPVGCPFGATPARHRRGRSYENLRTSTP